MVIAPLCWQQQQQQQQPLVPPNIGIFFFLTVFVFLLDQYIDE